METSTEIIEGEDDESPSLDYPIDTLLIRNDTRTVHDVLRRIEKGSFIMDPDFQRDFIWPESKQSKLIESVLMRIPLPVFYLAENKMGLMVVVDGLQRLSTFQRFVNNKFAIKLPYKSELNGKKFKGLAPKLQNRIEDCNLILYIIDFKASPQVLLDIFDRVNSGIPLSRQQMRNCLYMGKATTFLKTEANSQLFLDATGGSLDPKTMKDREFVNRFCAFKLLGVEKYTNGMEDFLVNALNIMNNLDEDKLRELSLEFRTSLKNNTKVFGKHAFRKHTPSQTNRNMINASLWDVMSVGLSRFPEHLVEANVKQLKTAFYKLLKDELFLDSITLGTSQKNRIIYRFDKFNEILMEVFSDYTN